MTIISKRMVEIVQAAAGCTSQEDAQQIAQRLADAGVLKRPPSPLAAEHGTTSAYEKCRKRPEGSCDACKAAKRVYIDTWKDRRDPNRPRRATRADNRRTDPVIHTELPGGGYAEREWKSLSPAQRRTLLSKHSGGRASLERHFINIGRGLVRRGLCQDRPGLPLSGRGRALAQWATTESASTES